MSGTPYCCCARPRYRVKLLASAERGWQIYWPSTGKGHTQAITIRSNSKFCLPFPCWTVSPTVDALRFFSDL
eukprot:4914721-Amphidinium_carterae.1